MIYCLLALLAVIACALLVFNSQGVFVFVNVTLEYTKKLPTSGEAESFHGEIKFLFFWSGQNGMSS